MNLDLAAIVCHDPVIGGNFKMAKFEERLTVRMPIEVRVALDDLARVDGRSTGDYVRRLLAAHVASQSKPKKKEK